jgi:alkylation response protein AidB-like acyl-CoA dehydrogenase
MTDVPDLLYSADQSELRSAVRRVLDDHSSSPAVLLAAEDRADRLTAWRYLDQQVGVRTLTLAEAADGANGTWSDAAVVLEELGRSIADTPFLTSAVLATSLLRNLGADEQLRRVAAGSTVAVAVPFSAAPLADVDAQHSDGALTGTVRSVAGASDADLLLVPVDGYVVAVESADARLRPVVSLDLTRRLTDVHFDRTQAVVLGNHHESGAALRKSFDIACALLASEQVGVAEWCLDTTVEYVKTRRQFGRPIGSFQAIKHRLADLWSAVGRSRAVARYAAACATSDSDDLATAASLAQAVCGEVAVLAAEECVQLHGGVGFTWEHPAHLYLKRARADDLALGSSSWHRARIGRLQSLDPDVHAEPKGDER